MIIKQDLEIGDLLICNDGRYPQYAVVHKLKSELNTDPPMEFDSPFVVVEIVKTKERRKVNVDMLAAIRVNYNHLIDLGVEHNERDEIPVYVIGKLTMSTIIVRFSNEDFYVTGLSMVNDWDLWMKINEEFTHDNIRENCLARFPFVGHLHLLLRELNKQVMEYDLTKLMQPLP